MSEGADYTLAVAMDHAPFGAQGVCLEGIKRCQCLFTGLCRSTEQRGKDELTFWELSAVSLRRPVGDRIQSCLIECLLPCC